MFNPCLLSEVCLLQYHIKGPMIVTANMNNLIVVSDFQRWEELASHFIWWYSLTRESVVSWITSIWSEVLNIVGKFLYIRVMCISLAVGPQVQCFHKVLISLCRMGYLVSYLHQCIVNCAYIVHCSTSTILLVLTWSRNLGSLVRLGSSMTHVVLIKSSTPLLTKESIPSFFFSKSHSLAHSSVNCMPIGTSYTVEVLL